MGRFRVVVVAVVMLVLSIFLVVGSGYAGEINLPRTGQTFCYNVGGDVIPCTGTGQDGALQEGVAWPSPRFQDMNNGTIRDNLTGLIWLKNGNCTDTVGGINKSSGTLTWTNALTWTNNLASGYCGLTDGSNAGQWRLPNVNELKSLVNVGTGSMATWLNGQGFTNIQSDKYWSSTTYTSIPSLAWITEMVIGNTDGWNKTDSSIYVLPVRGGQDGAPDSNYPANIPKTGQTSCYDASGNVIPCTGTGQDGALQKGVTWPSPRYSITYCNNTGPCASQSSDCDTNSSNDIIRDNLTGLTWPRDGSLGGGKTWADALTYANTFTLCGMSGWRLPNLNERVSLMNFGQSNMSAWLNDNNFINVPGWYFWSSSTGTATTTNAWYTAMAGGAISTIAKTNYDFYAWPVKSSCEYPPSGMISWWRAEDNADDSVGTNHGTLMNGATYAPGKVGKAFSFDGAKYIEIPHKASQNTGSQITVDAWIYLNTMGHGRSIIQKRSAGNVGGFTFETLHGNYGVDNGLQFVIWSGGSIKTAITSTNVLSLNTWHHVAATYDGSNMKIYVDGVEKGSFATTGNIDAVTDSMIVGVNVTNSSSFDGLIDELELYNRALTASEIQSIYLAGSAGKCFTPDTTPDAFTFTDQTNVPISTEIISNPITVSGINSPATIVIESCTTTPPSCYYQINNGSWVSTSGTVLNGDIVKVKQTSSSNPSTTTDLILDIEGVWDTFSVTTQGSTKNITVSKLGSGAGSAIVTSIPSGMNCGGTCVFGFPEGSKVTLLFSPTPSWIQVGGNPSISGTNGLTIRELNADTTVTVNFP